MSQSISLSKTLKPTTQTQKPSHEIQNRQNNMKHIALISAKLKYIHSMCTYTHKQNITKQIETHSSIFTQKKNQIDYHHFNI